MNMNSISFYYSYSVESDSFCSTLVIVGWIPYRSCSRRSGAPGTRRGCRNSICTSGTCGMAPHPPHPLPEIADPRKLERERERNHHHFPHSLRFVR
ncbi:hypothetical protein CEXT_518411 [Caerostris extrusa]|uniref:Uncharacterized protein n=1 Tax=Caerostris extrusa TaxID=172846 RepID=A0AAV4MK33_CAEEX|nr:hypothetical protein CEXT_518411 [Caerostris extrusa]